MKLFSEDEISNIAGEIVAMARRARRSFCEDGASENSHATLITLQGDLGAGKTTLTKEIARQLGVIENLQSPTYVIYKKYEIPPRPSQSLGALPLKGGDTSPELLWKFLIHGDMYRLESGSDLEKLGWQELLKNPKNLIIIEWPELVADSIPDYAIKIFLTHQGDLLRGIDF